jgi:hypothetical protein
MHYHPETLLVLHKERQERFEAEAARYALVKALRRRRRPGDRGCPPDKGGVSRTRLRWRRPSPLKPLPVRLRPLL